MTGSGDGPMGSVTEGVSHCRGNRVTDGEIKIKKDIVSEVPELLTAN